MSSSTRIPRKLETFIVYIMTVNEYLSSVQTGATEKRGIVLGMTVDELAQLGNFVKMFVSGDPTHPGLWDLHSNRSTKTVTTRQNMEDGMKNFIDFFRPVLNRIASNVNITNNDRNTLNIARPVTSHVTPSTPIAAKCFVDITMLGQGEVKYECHASADSTRSSRAQGSDAVELAYCSLPMEDQKDADGNILPTKVKPRQMMGPGEATDHYISTKALFNMKFSDSNLGNNLQIFFRWINTKHPELAGPWSALFSVIIS